MVNLHQPPLLALPHWPSVTDPSPVWQELVFSIKQQDLPYCKLVVAVCHRKKVAKDVHLGMNVSCTISLPGHLHGNETSIVLSMVHAVHSFVFLYCIFIDVITIMQVKSCSSPQLSGRSTQCSRATSRQSGTHCPTTRT